jgi:hypothetical protein
VPDVKWRHWQGYGDGTLRQGHPDAFPSSTQEVGESVGRYEGDTLVVDTVGIAAKPMSFIDQFGTPHTDKLHVIERFRIADGGKMLKVAISVDDSGAFTTKWGALATLQRSRNDFVEYVCAENNPMIGIGPSVGEMPRAKYVPPF